MKGRIDEKTTEYFNLSTYASNGCVFSIERSIRGRRAAPTQYSLDPHQNSVDTPEALYQLILSGIVLRKAP